MDDFVYEHHPRPEVAQYLPRTGIGSVLDVGCGSGGFGESLRDAYGASCEIVGLEPHARGAARARDTGSYSEVIIGTYPEALPDGSRFDCIVFNDVLEHLTDPWNVLAETHRHLNPGGRVVASIPNIQYLPVMWNLARHSRFDYTETGVLDRTHLRFFTWKTMSDMFIHAGYSIDEIHGVNSAFRWRPWSRVRFVRRWIPSFEWMQYVIVSSPSDHGTTRQT